MYNGQYEPKSESIVSREMKKYSCKYKNENNKKQTEKKEERISYKSTKTLNGYSALIRKVKEKETN